MLEVFKLPNNWLGYMATEGMDSVAFFALVPLLFHLTEHITTDDHHTSTAITNYGILLGVISLGRLIGRDFLKGHDHQDNLLFYSLTMTVALMLIAFCSNYSVFLFIFLLKEGLGSVIGRVYVSIHASNRISPDRGISSMSPTLQTAFSSDNVMRRNLIALIFAAILSTFLYSDSKEVRFPAYFPCIFLAMVWNILIFLYQLKLVKQSISSSPYSESGRVINIKKSQRQQRVKIKNSLATGKPTDFSNVSNEVVPSNFVNFYNGNRVKAKEMYIKSLQWRYENDVDNLLITPQRYFHEVLDAYPHAIHGKSRDGCIVLYELLGQAKMSKMVESGITLDDLIWHFNLRNEYVFQKLFNQTSDEESNSATVANSAYGGFLGRRQSNSVNPTPNSTLNRSSNSEQFGQIMTIVDVKGISLSDLTSDVISFIKQSSDIIDSYYPGRVKRLVICNAPSWFSSVWTVVARVLPESVRQKIHIISGIERLDEFIPVNQRPVEYGGRGGHLGTAPEHKSFLQLYESWDENNTFRSLSNTTGKSTSRKNSNSWNIGSRLMTLFRGKSEDGSNKKSDTVKATKAFLGTKNNYKFDDATKQWTLEVDNSLADDTTLVNSEDSDESGSEEDESDYDDDSDDEETKRRRRRRKRRELRKQKEFLNNNGKGTSQLEEHALLLAIQAAHESSSNLYNQSIMGSQTSMASSASLVGLSSHISSNKISQLDNDMTSSPNNTVSYVGVSSDIKLSPELFLLTLTMYLFSSFMYVMVITLTPIWMMLKPVVGGLGYSTIDVGLVASGTAVILLLFDTYFRDRYSFIMKSSPLRMIRLTSCILFFTLLTVPIFLTVLIPPNLKSIESKSLGAPILIDTTINTNNIFSNLIKSVTDRQTVRDVVEYEAEDKTWVEVDSGKKKSNKINIASDADGNVDVKSKAKAEAKSKARYNIEVEAVDETGNDNDEMPKEKKKTKQKQNDKKDNNNPTGKGNKVKDTGSDKVEKSQNSDKKNSLKIDVSKALDDLAFIGNNRRRLLADSPSLLTKFIASFFKQTATTFHLFNLQTPRDSILYLPQPCLILAIIGSSSS